MRIVKSCKDYRGEASLESWLWQIVRNCLNDHFRRLGKQLPETEQDRLNQEVSEMGHYEPSSDVQSIQDCVRRGLAEFAKQAPERAYVLILITEGEDTAAIAAFLNRTLGATREYISQCRKKVKEFLGPCHDLLSAP